VQVIVEVTWECPAQCIQCPLRNMSGKGKTMSPETFGAVLSLFSKAFPNNEKSVVISGGEPSLLPNLQEYVSEGKRRGYYVTIVTNGIGVENILKTTSVDLIELSIDYFGNGHDRARGLPLWDKAERIITEYKGELVIRSTLFKDNYDDILKIRDWVNTLRKDIPVLVMPARGFETASEEVVERLSREQGISVSDTCPAGISSFVVNPDLEILACIFYRRVLSRIRRFDIGEVIEALINGKEMPRFPCKNKID